MLIHTHDTSLSSGEADTSMKNDRRAPNFIPYLYKSRSIKLSKWWRQKGIKFLNIHNWWKSVLERQTWNLILDQSPRQEMDLVPIKSATYYAGSTFHPCLIEDILSHWSFSSSWTPWLPSGLLRNSDAGAFIVLNEQSSTIGLP